MKDPLSTTRTLCVAPVRRYHKLPNFVKVLASSACNWNQPGVSEIVRSPMTFSGSGEYVIAYATAICERTSLRQPGVPQLSAKKWESTLFYNSDCDKCYYNSRICLCNDWEIGPIGLLLRIRTRHFRWRQKLCGLFASLESNGIAPDISRKISQSGVKSTTKSNPFSVRGYRNKSNPLDRRSWGEIAQT